MVVDTPCAIDTLNPLINGLIQQRDAILSIENVFGPEDPTMNVLLRARVQQAVHKLATALLGWTAVEG